MTIEKITAVMKKTFLTLVIGVMMVTVCIAQDPNFSQFFASPLTLNPALTGKFDGVVRVAGNYRNQWPAINNAFVTQTASVDFGILKNRLAEIDQMGVGVLGVSDRAGDGVLVTNYAALSLSFHKGLDEDGFHQIGAGFQAAYTNKRLDITKVKFGDQLTPLGFTGVTSEIFTNRQISVSYFDVNAGVFYNGSTNGYNNFYFGASMYHINRPKESFKGANFLLNPRLTLQAGGKIPVGSYHSLHLSSNLSFQANAKNFMAGGAFSYNVNNSDENPTNVYLGLWTRFNNQFSDAIIPYVGIEFGSFHLGYTYDANISALKAASNSIGGNEISLIWIKKPGNPDFKKLNCPRF
jgi:type IX secretion system PorP/SprF family membrane protein